MASVIVLMFLVMGSSQAMRSAWIEDVLSLVPAIVYLIATKYERRRPTHAFPFGFHRVHSLGFLVSAVTLTAVGVLLLVESMITLVRQEHVTIPPVTILGRDVWLGWLMIAALAYSMVPPVILGLKKLPIAKRLQDKVLHTDAMMQKADWMTGLAGIAGIIGLGFGFWWADAVAAAVISASIVHDGVTALRISTAELIDGAPRELDRDEVSEEAEALTRHLKARYPGSEVRLRETGRFINAQILGAPPDSNELPADLWPGDPLRQWRLAEVSFVAPTTDAKG